MNKLKKLRRRLRSRHSDDVIRAIDEVVRKYSNSCLDEIRIKGTPAYGNHRIGGFYALLPGDVFVFVDWKNGYEVGHTCLDLRDMYRQINADGCALYSCNTADGLEKVHITIVKDELDTALRCLADYLSPEKVYQREQSRLLLSVKDVLFKRVLDVLYDEVWQSYSTRRDKERYYNGQAAAMAFVGQAQDKYLAMGEAEFRKRILSVFLNNAKLDFFTRKGDDGRLVYKI